MHSDRYSTKLTTVENTSNQTHQLENKANKSSIYPAFPIQTMPLGNQIVDLGVFSLQNDFS